MSSANAQQICDALAILTTVGVADYNGHASVRAEGDGFFINTGASDRAAMTPEQICRVDADGGLVEGETPPNEVFLHAAIYAAQPEIAAIVHGHPKWSTLFTLTNTRIPVVMPQACLVADLPVYDQSHSINSRQRGDAVASLMGSRCGILLAGHGSVLGGTSLRQAVAYAIYTEQNAERAYRAHLLGMPTAIPESEFEDYRLVLAKPKLYDKCWNYYLGQRSVAHVR